MHRRRLHLRLVERKRNKCPGAQVIGDDEGRLARQAKSGEACGAQRIAIVGAEVAADLDTDLAVCADLAMATVRCGIYNVRVNLADVTDPGDRQKIESTLAILLDRGLGIIQRVSPAIWERNRSGK